MLSVQVMLEQQSEETERKEDIRKQLDTHHPSLDNLLSPSSVREIYYICLLLVITPLSRATPRYFCKAKHLMSPWCARKYFTKRRVMTFNLDFYLWCCCRGCEPC